MRYFRIGLAVLSSVVIFSSAFAQKNSVSGWARNIFIEGANENPDICFTTSSTFEKSKWGFATFADACKNWGEAYIGPRFTFNDNFFISAYGGLETCGDYWRVAIDVNFNFQKLNWYNVYEYGSLGSNGDFWFSDLTYSLTNSVKAEAKGYKIGTVYKFGGGGIYAIPKTPIALSPVALYNVSSGKPEYEAIVYWNF